MTMLPEAERGRAADNLRLAGRLGTETVTLVGRNVAEEIVDFARQRKVTRIVIGKPARAPWRRIFLPLAASVALQPPFGRCGDLLFEGPSPGPTCGFSRSGAQLHCR